jgi:uncharacterized membrane protein
VRTDRGFDRFITFIDAVVAIAITLLVLPLVDVLGGHLPHDVAAVFTQNGERFLSFLLSFAVIARLWIAHHRIVERVGAYDAGFVLANFGWALTIVFLPFATLLISEYPATDRLAVGVYIGTITLSSVCLAIIGVLVWQRPALRREGLTKKDVVPTAVVVNAGLFVVALALGTALPRVNYYALLLLFLSGLVDRWFGVRRPEDDGTEVTPAER